MNIYYNDSTRAVLIVAERDDLDLGVGVSMFFMDDADIPYDIENWEVNAEGDGLDATTILAGNTIEMTTDATDSTEPYDGIPDIVGNGSSTCKIILELKDSDGNRNTSAEGTAILETTRGRLSALTADMSGGISSTVTLQSVDETVVAYITGRIDGQPQIINRLQIQFT